MQNDAKAGYIYIWKEHSYIWTTDVQFRIYRGLSNGHDSQDDAVGEGENTTYGLSKIS